MLIGVEGHHLALALDLDRHDLLGEATVGYGLSRAGLRGQGKGVHLFPADLMFVGHILGRDAHVTRPERAV